MTDQMQEKWWENEMGALKGAPSFLVPFWLLAAPGLTVAGKMYMAYFMWFSRKQGFYNGGNRELAEAFGGTIHNARAQVRKLQHRGYIRVEYIRTQRGAVIERRIYPVYSKFAAIKPGGEEEDQ